MTTEERVKKLMLQNLDLKADMLTPTATLRSDLGATSVDLVELLADLENEFNVEISDGEAQKLRTFGDVISFIDGKLA